MSQVPGLYGHISRNINVSRWMIAGFVLATSVCWILCTVSYNVGFRQLFGEEYHHSMTQGGGVFAHSGGRRIDVGPKATPECRKNYSECKTIVIGKPTTLDLVADGVTSALKTLYVPILGVSAWLAAFWVLNGQMVSWAMGAIPASRMNEKRLFNIVENLSLQVGQPMPKIEIIESDAMNAFASGLSPEDSMIGVTRGLINKLTDAELEAVLAHEYTHILNRDTRVMVISTVFVGIFENLFHHFLSGITGAHEKSKVSAALNLPARLTVGIIVFGPLCASFAACWGPSLLGRAHLSRSREFLADAGAVELTKDADALVSALLKIERSGSALALPRTMQAMMIAGDSDGFLAQHPPIEERIAALRIHAGAELPPTRIRLASAIPAASGGQAVTFGRRIGSASVAFKR